MIPTPAEAMTAENRRWLEVIATFGRAPELEQILIAAEATEATDLDAVIRLISLAHVAHNIAAQEIVGTFGVWYRDMGQRLLCRAADAAAGLDQPSACLN